MPQNLPAYLETLLATSHDPVVLLDRQFHIRRSNHHFEEVFLFPDLLAPNSSLFEIQDGAWQRTGLASILQKVLAEDASFEDEEVLLEIPGRSPMPLLVNARKFHSMTNDSDLIFLVLEDLSERQKVQIELANAESKRRESENLFEVLADAAPVMIWLAGTDMRCYYFNRSRLAFSGKTLAQESGNGWMSGVHPEDFKRCSQAYQVAFASRKEFFVEYRLKRHDQQYRWVADRGVPRYDDAGHFSGFAGSCTDVHDQKDLSDTLEKMVRIRTEELEQSRLFMQSVLNSTYYGIASYEPLYNEKEEVVDFRISYTNAEVPSNFGMQVQDVLEKTCREVYPGIFENGIFEKMVHAMNTGQPATYEIQAGSKAKPIWLSAAIEKVNNSLTVTSKNITREKEAALHLEEINQELLHKNKELASLTYIASHDLQEPLRKIQMFISRILETEQQQMSDQGKSYFRSITNTAFRMQNLIDAVLSYSRMDSEKYKREKTNLNTLLKEVLGQMDMMLEERQVTIERAELPTIKVIQIHFQQLFLNIINNAVKYSKPEVPPVIKISAEQEVIKEQAYWKISFADNGIGFEPQYKEKIFEAFQRLHGKMEYAGTGIGLAICQKIAGKHGGFMTAEGIPNEGAVFHIHLPI